MILFQKIFQQRLNIEQDAIRQGYIFRTIARLSGKCLHFFTLHFPARSKCARTIFNSP